MPDPAKVGAVATELEQAHEAQRHHAWGEVYQLLRQVDERVGLGALDLELLATSAYLVGNEDEAIAALERAHQAHLQTNDRRAAARCAFWSGFFFMLRNDTGQATGWLARARRLLDDDDAGECIEHGLLLLPVAEQQLLAGDANGASEHATRAAAIGVRFNNADVTAAARHLQGRAELLRGNIDSGLALLDETMLAVIGGELSPVLAGLLYCSVIDACLHVLAFSRAREWTAALTRWCTEQPQLVAFTGTCLVHRAHIMQLNGAWQDVIEEVRGARDRFARGEGRRPLGSAFYEEAEVHRLRGEYEAADEGYRNASELGCEPQPGLALMRLAQGRVGDALAAMRRVVNATTEPLARSRLLPAFVDVLLAAGELEHARDASDELQSIAESFPSDAAKAISAHARAVTELCTGNPTVAIAAAREAWQIWERIGAPYPSARAREIIGLACDALGDVDGKRLELEAARAAFQKLGAIPDVARIQSRVAPPASSAKALHSQLTARELQVIRLIAAGKTNRAIADQLGVSEKTVERHVSNLFVKIGVPSRAAATAYAYEHQLV